MKMKLPNMRCKSLKRKKKKNNKWFSADSLGKVTSENGVNRLFLLGFLSPLNKSIESCHCWLDFNHIFSVYYFYSIVFVVCRLCEYCHNNSKLSRVFFESKYVYGC